MEKETYEKKKSIPSYTSFCTSIKGEQWKREDSGGEEGGKEEKQERQTNETYI